MYSDEVRLVYPRLHPRFLEKSGLAHVEHSFVCRGSWQDVGVLLPRGDAIGQILLDCHALLVAMIEAEVLDAVAAYTQHFFNLVLFQPEAIRQRIQMIRQTRSP